jgi:hypothetical protein
MTTDKRRFTMVLGDELYDFVQLASEEEGISMGSWIRRKIANEMAFRRTNERLREAFIEQGVGEYERG